MNIGLFKLLKPLIFCSESHLCLADHRRRCSFTTCNLWIYTALSAWPVTSSSIPSPSTSANKMILQLEGRRREEIGLKVSCVVSGANLQNISNKFVEYSVWKMFWPSYWWGVPKWRDGESLPESVWYVVFLNTKKKTKTWNNTVSQS